MTTNEKVHLVCNFCGHKFWCAARRLFSVECPKCHEGDVDVL